MIWGQASGERWASGATFISSIRINNDRLEGKSVKSITLDDFGLVKRPLWDPRTGRMEETNNRALQVLDQLMDGPGVGIEAFKRVANYCDEEET